MFHITEPEKNLNIKPNSYHLNLESVKKTSRGDILRHDRPKTGRTSTAHRTTRSITKTNNTIQIDKSIEVLKGRQAGIKEILLKKFPLLDQELINKISTAIEGNRRNDTA